MQKEKEAAAKERVIFQQLETNLKEKLQLSVQEAY